jgi:hypothetical protein
VQIETNPTLVLSGLLLKNKNTGKFETVPSRMEHTQYRSWRYYSHEEWETVAELSGYARNRRATSGWGAYILPIGLEQGERVYIADLIEDIYAFGIWRSVGAAADAEAVWTGEHLDIDISAYNKFEVVG